MRKTCLNMVYELAKRDERVVFIGSDLSPGLLAEMKQEMPERYYMEGITEANVIGMAAGLAMEGYIPYVNTIATFITRRCYEQVAVDLCLHDLPVRLIGNGGGLVYAPLGPTHLAIEDIAIMRALPNMTVIAVCDAEEMMRCMECTLDWPRSDLHPPRQGRRSGRQPARARLYDRQGDPDASRASLATGGADGNRSHDRPTASRLPSCSPGTASTRPCVHFHTVKPLDEAMVREHAACREPGRDGRGGRSDRRLRQRRHRLS